MSRQFTSIRGGLSDNMHTSRRELEEAFVTNTRLMGVLTLYLHFRLPENQVMKDIHQFFYFDIEEYGFEDYKAVKDGNMDTVKAIENNLTGGLGGKNVPVTLKEAAYLLQKYTKYNFKHGLPMPEGEDDYNFLLEMDADLTPEEIDILNKKTCVEIDSEYEAVNYFLMRCVGKDFEGASLISKPGMNLDLFPDFSAGTFLRNTVNRRYARNRFVSESLVEFDDDYHLMVTDVICEDYCITKYDRVSAFKISPSEAALLLAKPEYISVYKIPEGNIPFDKNKIRLASRAAVTDHEAGKLYMIYHLNNKHVAKSDYRLDEDVLGIYYVIDNRQVVVVAYSYHDERTLERNLLASEFGKNLQPGTKYEFLEPLFFDFVQYGLDDFEEFVNYLKSLQE